MTYVCDVNACTVACGSAMDLLAHRMADHETPKASTCQTCGIIFVDKLALESHQNTHVKCKCTFCDESFSTLSFLEDHQLAVHQKLDGQVDSNTSTFICKSCGACYFQSHYLLRHYETQHSCFHCLVCEDDFTSKILLKQHQATAHDIVDVENAAKLTYKCKTCDASFKRKRNFRRHRENCDPRFAYSDDSDTDMGSDWSVSAGDTDNDTPDDGISNMANNVEMNSQMINEGDKAVSEQAKIANDPESVTSPLIEQISNTYICPLCDQQFSHKQNLITHLFKLHKQLFRWNLPKEINSLTVENAMKAAAPLKTSGSGQTSAMDIDINDIDYYGLYLNYCCHGCQTSFNTLDKALLHTKMCEKLSFKPRHTRQDITVIPDPLQNEVSARSVEKERASDKPSPDEDDAADIRTDKVNNKEQNKINDGVYHKDEIGKKPVDSATNVISRKVVVKSEAESPSKQLIRNLTDKCDVIFYDRETNCVVKIEPDDTGTSESRSNCLVEKEPDVPVPLHTQSKAPSTTYDLECDDIPVDPHDDVVESDFDEDDDLHLESFEQPGANTLMLNSDVHAMRSNYDSTVSDSVNAVVPDDSTFGRQSPVVGHQSRVVGRQSPVVGRQSPVVDRQSPVVSKPLVACNAAQAPTYGTINIKAEVDDDYGDSNYINMKAFGIYKSLSIKLEPLSTVDDKQNVSKSIRDVETVCAYSAIHALAHTVASIDDTVKSLNTFHPAPPPPDLVDIANRAKPIIPEITQYNRRLTGHVTVTVPSLNKGHTQKQGNSAAHRTHVKSSSKVTPEVRRSVREHRAVKRAFPGATDSDVLSAVARHEEEEDLDNRSRRLSSSKQIHIDKSDRTYTPHH